MTFNGQRYSRVATLVAALLFSAAAPESTAWADATDFLKGCVVLGTIGVGGTAVAVAVSKATISNPQALIVAGVTGCLIGGFIAGDIARKAELNAAGELTMQNIKLKNSVYSVMHDLCVIKHTCGPDGLPLPKPTDDAGGAGGATGGAGGGFKYGEFDPYSPYQTYKPQPSGN